MSFMQARVFSMGTVAATALFSAMVFAVASGAALAGEIPKVGEKAPDFTLESLGGGKVRLADASAEGSVVLVVLRGYPGYQCPICTAQVAELVAKAKDLSDKKTRVIMVYPGPAGNLKAHADEFVGGKAFPKNFEMVLDPDYAFTKAYGLRWDAPNETAYPSTFVLGPAGKILFAKVSRTHGGRAKVAEVLKSLPK